MRIYLIAAFIMLCLAASLPAPHSKASYHTYATTARVTFYDLTGITASGVYTGPGVAACSYDLPLGTQVVLLDSGETYTCLDRGLLGSGYPYTWLDLWSSDGWTDVVPWGQYRPVEIIE